MPISVSPLPPPGVLTPGITISWDSNHSPVGGQSWFVTLSQQSGGFNSMSQHKFDQTSTCGQVQFLVHDAATPASSIHSVIPDDTTAFVTIELINPDLGIVDSTNISATYTVTDGLPLQTNELAQKK